MWEKGKAQALALVAQRTELWAATGLVLCREHSLLSQQPFLVRFGWFGFLQSLVFMFVTIG